MKFLITMAIVAIWTTAGAANLKTPATTQTLRDLEYARVNNKSLRLDLYLPDNATGPLPLIVWIHGGGWVSGSKDLDANGPQLWEVSRGYAVASIDYRLSLEAKFPAQIEDCKAAIRWLRAHAAQYNLDVNRIAATGASAGGHLAALLGTSANVSELEGAAGGNLDHSSRVQAVVDWFGPVDLLRMSDDSLPLPCAALDHNSPLSPESLLIGCAIQTCPNRTERANPIHYVNGDEPPFLILHGTEDCLVGPHQSERLRDALQAAGIVATLKFVEGAGHGGAEFSNAENQRLVDDFFDQMLRTAIELPTITGASVAGKKLFVYGTGFDSGTIVLLDGARQKTANDEQNATTTLVAKKAGKKIVAGQPVTLRVENPDGRLSEEFRFTRQ
jgi:acetyl esterase/lipase